MNKKGEENRSVRNTRRKLREALIAKMKEKPISEITAKELAETVDISRGTFYLHYDDVFDLLKKTEENFFDEFDRVLNSEEAKLDRAFEHLTAIFAFIGENADLCRVMLGANGDISFVLRIQKHIDDKCSSMWKQCATPKDNTLVDREREELYNAFIIYGCMGIVRKWIEGGLKDPPEKISALAASIITSTLPGCLFAE
mgnify:FL=1